MDPYNGFFANQSTILSLVLLANLANMNKYFQPQSNFVIIYWNSNEYSLTSSNLNEYSPNSNGYSMNIYLNYSMNIHDIKIEYSFLNSEYSKSQNAHSNIHNLFYAFAWIWIWIEYFQFESESYIGLPIIL